MTVALSRVDLDAAVAAGILTADQAEALWTHLHRRPAATGGGTVSPLPDPRPPTRARFDMVHVAYYFGALIVISAMGWFMTLGWERFGGLGIFSIALVYGFAFFAAGRVLWKRPGLLIPGGLLLTMMVAMTPLAVYGLERWLGLWPATDPGNYRGFHEWIKGGWFLMELGTILVGLLTVRSFRFPFLVAPIAFVLWYMSMDLAPLLFGSSYPSWNERCWVSAGVGLAMLLAGVLIDQRTREDFAFWLYLFGLLAFEGGLSALESASEFRKALYGLLNLGLMGVSVLLGRRAFLVFGSLGVFGYLGHLAYRVFEKSMVFPFVLSGIGLGIIALAILYQRNRNRVDGKILELVPLGVRRHLPRQRPPE